MNEIPKDIRRELRIGNYVNFIVKTTDNKDIKILSKVECLHRNVAELSDGINTFTAAYVTNIEAIPLTEEILLSFGFMKKDENGRYGYIYFKSHNDYNYVVERDFNKYPSHFFGIEYTDSPNPEDDYKPEHFSFDMKYVHQLQNMWFALTGEELISKFKL